MSTPNIRFYGEICKIMPKLPPNTIAICSTEKMLFIYSCNHQGVHILMALCILWSGVLERSLSKSTGVVWNLILEWQMDRSCFNLK